MYILCEVKDDTKPSSHPNSLDILRNFESFSRDISEEIAIEYLQGRGQDKQEIFLTPWVLLGQDETLEDPFQEH